MSAAKALLRDHLLHRQMKGETHVLLRPGVLDAAHGVTQKPVKAVSAPEMPKRLDTAPAAEARVILEKAPEVARPSAELISVSGSTKAEKITALAAIEENWEPVQ